MKNTALEKPDQRRTELSKIHIAKVQLGMSEEDYRAMLQAVGGKNSAAELGSAERKRVLEHLERCGFKPRPKNAGAWKGRRLADSDQCRKMRALWLALHEHGYVENPAEAALIAWVSAQAKVDALEWLTVQQAQRLIEQMKKWRARDEEKVRPLAIMLFNQGRIASPRLDELAMSLLGAGKVTRDVCKQLFDHLKGMAGGQG